ncbi:thiamine pyrophosphate-requiring protein [Roseicyclus elongatus]|uniref:thiamine pyrophosphate-requiring protein n=1 Tax=Roseicyclus elongatus TaxID=159346 RepID=UPI001FE07FD8|nr:thiamine pyrophosphate-requiring protein [Roseibacterium elongatum]
MTKERGGMTAGGAIFQRLKALGVEYVFANSGTDFPPIIEGLAEAAAKGVELPQAIPIPHEHAAMGMAHGHYLMSGRAQAVMLHTNVGLANGAIGAINAACDHVPMLLMSGRTPVTEGGRFGARTVPIGWGQEMFDQTALVRESVKWDYELRFPEQVAPLLDRAHAIASSTPRGPVYLALPREVLCQPVAPETLAGGPSMVPACAAPDPAAITRAAEMLAGAARPVIIAQRGAGDAASFAAFADWVADWGIPVCSWWATHLALDTDHPCHVGPDPGPWLAEADVVVVLDCLAPWWPDRHCLSPEAKVIHLGPDPLFSRAPARTFRCDLAVAGETALTIPALIAAMGQAPADHVALSARRQKVAAAAAADLAGRHAQAQAGRDGGISKAWVSHCLSEALADRPSSVFSELGTILGPLERRGHRSWFQEPHSGGLGWSFPAAMGARLAAPERTVVATIGDGSYMFANPTACHQIAEALGLNILVIVLNNAEVGGRARLGPGALPRRVCRARQHRAVDRAQPRS